MSVAVAPASVRPPTASTFPSRSLTSETLPRGTCIDPAGDHVRVAGSKSSAVRVGWLGLEEAAGDEHLAVVEQHRAVQAAGGAMTRRRAPSRA